MRWQGIAKDIRLNPIGMSTTLFDSMDENITAGCTACYRSSHTRSHEGADVSWGICVMHALEQLVVSPKFHATQTVGCLDPP